MTVPSDAEIVGLMAKLYAPQPGDFDHIEDPSSDDFGDDGVCWAAKQYGGLAVLVFRGSMTKEDWFRDAISELPAPGSRVPQCAEFGVLPLGFGMGMYAAMTRWTAYTRSRVIIAGHSLGAARAVIAAALDLAYGGTVDKIVLCGCPRPGTNILTDYLADIDIRSYRNLGDPVCDVPTEPPWAHVRPFTALSEPPPAGDISIFRDHHIELYEAGVAKLGA